MHNFLMKIKVFKFIKLTHHYVCEIRYFNVPVGIVRWC